MNYFKQQHDLPVLDLKNELDSMLDQKVIAWHKDDTQICINTVDGEEDNIYYGSGSLVWDWSNQKEVLDDNGNVIKIIPKPFKKPKKESDFTVLCSQFKGTVFEEVYNAVKDKFNIGRMRLMLMRPKSCLTWHNDFDTRLHFPITTNIGCRMVIENEVMHMPANTWWLTNTSVNHTAFNASVETRIHLVTSILKD